MAEDGHQSVPASLILMGGPVDVRVAPTKVNEVAFDRPLSWFEQHVIHPVPDRHVGRGRRVYPGFLQLGGFMSMNPARHSDQHRALLGHLAEGRADEASRIREFYDEYFAVLDIDADFYLETIDLVFQRCALAEGKLAHRGRPVRPAAITTTALLTIEGERDDICAPGQTSAAHALCSGLPDALKHAHVQPGVGHYGIFSGSRWESDIYPLVRRHIAAARAKPATAKKRSSPDSPGSRR
jgi:polyhydroxyalkanoate depolymerase